MMLHKDRTFISFDGNCTFGCKHCYTFSLSQENKKIRTIKEILDDVKEQQFDIIYVSQKNENFSDANAGLHLCEMAYERYNTDILIITRNILDDSALLRLYHLSEKMKKNNNKLIVAVSFVSLNKYEISERVDLVPSPNDRIRFLGELKQIGIPTFSLIRPLFPNEVIPIYDVLELIDRCKEYVNCIVSSELGVNSDIEKRLGIDFKQYYGFKSNEYLNGAISDSLKFLNLETEMSAIAQKCTQEGIKFFTHSMQAVNYICEE